MKKEIYVVFGRSGCYCELSEWPVCYFEIMDDAIIYADLCTNAAKRVGEHLKEKGLDSSRYLLFEEEDIAKEHDLAVVKNSVCGTVYDWNEMLDIFDVEYYVEKLTKGILPS